MTFKILGDPRTNNAWRMLGASGHGGFQWSQLLDFEAGLLIGLPNAFDSVAGAGVATLAVNQASAIRGNYGLSVGIPGDSAVRYGQITGPDAETTILLEFLFDPNSIVMGAGEGFHLVNFVDAGGVGGRAMRIDFNNVLGNYRLDLIVIDDAGGIAPGATPVVITDEAILVKIEYKASSAPGADDGIVRGYVDGEMFSEQLTLDNDTHNVDALQFGAIAGVDAGTNGTMYFDNISWATIFR